jgi:hypothetical protein
MKSEDLPDWITEMLRLDAEQQECIILTRSQTKRSVTMFLVNITVKKMTLFV